MSRKLAADLARRTERMRAEPAAEDDSAPINPLAAAYNASQAAKQQRTHELLFGSEPEPESPPDKSTGDVGAGKGDAGEQRYEHVAGEVMEVLDLDQVMDPKRRS